MTFTPDDVFHLSLAFRTGAATPPAARLELTIHKMLDCERVDDDDRTLAVWGAPAIDGRIVGAAELARRLRAESVETLAPRLDCAFLIVIHDRGTGVLTVVNDRFGSLPFFYQSSSGEFLASTSFKRLFDRRGAAGSPGFDPWAVGEFLYFRRVLNTRSYDRAISFLAGGSILSVSASGEVALKPYWRLRAEKLGESADALAERLADALANAMRTAMSDARRFGLLLSGGLDARALLAAAPSPPLCITTTPKPNNELAVARELAALRGAEHIYIPRPETLLNDALGPSVALSGGMTVFHETQFIGYGPQVCAHADTLFMGLGLDIMFGGLYLPKSTVTFAGRSGWHYRLHALADDLPRMFVDQVSYRLKTSDPMQVIRPERRDELRERLIDSVRCSMDEGRALGLQGYDVWDYVHLHNLARHYSFLMAQSVRTFAACRLPAMNNALYDLCWAMRAEDKANWRVYQKAIARLSPELMAVRNANTNIRASLPLWQQSLIKFTRAIAQRAGFEADRSPSWWDRSWPQTRQAIDANPAIRDRVSSLPGSAALEAAGLFDLREIGKVVEQHRSGAHDHSILLSMLVTIDRALEPFAG